MVAPLVVVMGVSGVGKSAVGQVLADLTGVEYADGDDFHSPANIAKMRRGIALVDEDRWPWLEDIGRWLHDHDGSGGVVSCSVLRRSYRDVLTRYAPRAMFLHLVGDPNLIGARITSRDHFMPPALLQSQLDSLEPLQPDENGGAFDITPPPRDIARAFLRRYQFRR